MWGGAPGLFLAWKLSYDLTKERPLTAFVPPLAFMKTVPLFFAAALTVGQSRTSAFSDTFAHFLVCVQSPITDYEILSFTSRIVVLFRTVSS